MFVDSHTHLYTDDFDADREAVLQRAFQSGIEAIISIGIDVYHSQASIDLAAKFARIFATVGFHPDCSIALDDQTYSQLAEMARQPKVVAIGEIGLDFLHNISARDVQLKAFRRQLELASQLNLPVVIHERNAHREVVAALKQWSAASPLTKGGLRGVVHGFSGDSTMAQECVGLGFLISVAGSITYPDEKKLVDVVRRLPLEKLIIETDCPFLAPYPNRRARNEPANLRIIAEKIAEIKGVTVEEVGKATTRNAATLFNLALLESQA